MYLVFRQERSVRALLQACSHGPLSPVGLSEYYFKMSTRRMPCKEVGTLLAPAYPCFVQCDLSPCPPCSRHKPVCPANSCVPCKQALFRCLCATDVRTMPLLGPTVLGVCIQAAPLLLSRWIIPGLSSVERPE